MGKLRLPDGKRVAVILTTDVCAQCLWMGGMNTPSPAAMARGEFDARVGTQRLLKLYREFDIRTTFFIPGHTLDTFPETCEKIAADGHELGHHGYYHEDPRRLDLATERKLMALGFDAYARRLGVRPVGYRASALDFSPNTLDLLEEFEFLYDSSMMAHDLQPYRPQRWQVRWEQGSVAGPASSVLEIPPSWFLDDFPAISHVPGMQEGLTDTTVWLDRHKQVFEYAYTYEPGSCYVPAVHPQTAGQAHMMLAMRSYLEYLAGFSGTWFTTLEKVAACWEDDDEDRRLMALPDARGTEPPPAGSGLTPYEPRETNR